MKEIEINEENIYLTECLKVEGYYSLKNFTLTIQNKDISLLEHMEKIAKSLGSKVSKRILLKIGLEENQKKDQIKIYHENKELSFHIERSPFDKSKVKAVTNLPAKKRHTLNVRENKKDYEVKVNYRKEQIETISQKNCWAYGEIRFPNKELLEFLERYNNKKRPGLEKTNLKKSPKIAMSALSALVDCEGSINWTGLKRIIRVRMRNKEYLKRWSEIIQNHDVKCHLRKNSDKEYQISIHGWKNFKKLEEKGFRLYHSKKSKRWRKIMKGFKRKQISRNESEQYYVKKLKEMDKKVTSKELSNYIGKSKRVVNTYLLKLEKEGKIKCDRNSWPYLYSIFTSSVR